MSTPLHHLLRRYRQSSAELACSMLSRTLFCQRCRRCHVICCLRSLAQSRRRFGQPYSGPRSLQRPAPVPCCAGMAVGIFRRRFILLSWPKPRSLYLLDCRGMRACAVTAVALRSTTLSCHLRTLVSDKSARKMSAVFSLAALVWSGNNGLWHPRAQSGALGHGSRWRAFWRSKASGENRWRR